MLVPPTVQGRKGLCFGCGQPLTVPMAAGEGAAALEFAEGQQIENRYVIGGRLGQGGMGVVYSAQDTLLDEQVALKFLHPQRLRSERARRLFLREAQIARRLRHDHIVSVHDVSTTIEGVPYLSMELLQGLSLRGYLRERRKQGRFLDIRLAVRLTGQVLDALSYAHRYVIHRDIKPENVMLMPGEHVKVLDFGLAKVVDEGPEEGGHRPIGTAAYAAPEQKTHRDVDLRADLFSVGLVLRELLTLRTPIEEPSEVSALRLDVSPSLLAVIRRAVHPDKSQRWQNAAEFAAALRTAFSESYRPAAADERAEGAPASGASRDGMVFLEGGSFLMGNDAVATEAFEREVTVEPFYIDRHPVTNGQYGAFVRATGHPEPKYWRQANYSGPDQPVTGVSYDDARAYARWAGKELPSEAQWECAARGKENRKYPWGGREPDSTLANFGGYLGMPSIAVMHEEGATPEGVCDLAGNVHEWTRDPYVPYALQEKAVAQGGTAQLAVRGGAWDSPADALRCSARQGMFAETKAPNLGFRCVLRA